MATENTIEFWKRASDDHIEQRFPKYFVSQPPHRDTLQPIYFKVCSPDGPVFWRHEDADTGRETTFFDFHQEAVNGYGVNKLRKKYTPWGENGD